MRRVLLVGLLLLIATAVSTAAFAQATQGVKVLVQDPMGGPVAGALITVVGEGGAPVATGSTDAAGGFSKDLPAGRYTVRVSAPGFTDGQRVAATMSADAAATPIILAIAAIREDVIVTAPGGYQVPIVSTATKTPTPLRDVPQSVTVVTRELIRDQMMMSVGDVLRYVPGVMVHQGENNRDQVIIRGNSSSADFFVNGVRDDVQYYRDLYNLERVETLKGPNAMIFGRGGAGGVVNRVSKEASFQRASEFALQGGMFGNRRFTVGLNEPLNEKVAFRLDGMLEDSSSFRDHVGLNRFGLTPTLTIVPSTRTRVVLRYENLHDERVADRGITSFQGRPADIDTSTFYGNPNLSHVNADVNVFSGTIEHRTNRLTIRNHTVVGNYDRSYQNFVPGAASANASQVTLTSYNNATNRTNLFNQTDLTTTAATGPLKHTLLVGAEFGRQLTDNFRNTGFFNDTTTSILVPFASPTISTPVTYRQSATDADNHLIATVVAGYVQDQVEISRYIQAVGGVRVDQFALNYHNNRNGDTLERPDTLVSPRVGLIFKPVVPVSVYTSYSVSYLPGSGDQFSSLTNITEQLKPEQIQNYEGGVKWDVSPNFSFTTALYQLNRTNTRSTDPNDPTRIIQTGSQRTNGYELGVNGRVLPMWSIAGGYAYQDAYVSSATTAAPEGAQVGQVPHHTLSLWNNYRLHPKLSAGVGVLYRSDMFVAVDNAVVVPGYTRVDAAGFYTLSRQMRLQVNVENLFDNTYYINADSNTNISPGFPRAIRVGVTGTF